MSVSTLEAPGISIKEIDKSQYSPSMGGTRCYVMGHTSKGEPYVPMQFTSKPAWTSYFGNPSNEAEKYFYSACSEVIDNNGVLYCAKLPYDNKAKDKMVGFKYKVGSYIKSIPTAGEWLQGNSDVAKAINHDADFEKDAISYIFDTRTYRRVGDKWEYGFERDTEIKRFYHQMLDIVEKGTMPLSDEVAKYDQKLVGHTENLSCGSVEFYQVNLSASEQLRKRFLTKKEAEEYMDEMSHMSIPCVTKVYTHKDVDKNPDLSGLLFWDNGDWYAQPLCAEFHKVCIFESLLDFEDIQKIDDLRKNTQTLIDNEEDKSDFINMIYVEDIDKNINILYSKYIDTEGPKNKTVNDLKNQIEELFKTIKVKGEVYWDKQGKSVIQNFINTELSVYDTIKIENIYYGLSGKSEYKAHDYTIPVPKYIDKLSVNDGYDTEILYRNTVSGLVDMYMNTISPTSMYKELFSGDQPELWKGYWNQSLGNILQENANIPAEELENMSTDEIEEKYKEIFDNFIININRTGKPATSWEEILNIFKKEANPTYQDIIDRYGSEEGKYQDLVSKEVPYYQIVDLDNTLDNYLTINSTQNPITIDLKDVDEYRTGEANVPAQSFYIVDKTCATLNKVPEDKRKGSKRELIGIFPVVTTAANALYAQSLINVVDNDVPLYETATNAVTKKDPSTFTDNEADGESYSLLIKDITRQFSNHQHIEDIKMGRADDTSLYDTVSRDANGFFLPITTNTETDKETGRSYIKVDTTNMKKIGVVVYKAYLDASEGNKVSFDVVESFCGSLDKTAKDPNTGVSTFIDEIINTNSNYIYFFSNCFVSTAQKKTYNNDADFFVVNPGVTGMLGFFSDETQDTISLPCLYQGIDKCFENVKDKNERDIDIVCDAGLANIAQFLKSVYGGKTPQRYDLYATDEAGNPLINKWTCKSANDTKTWKTVEQKFDTFCKNVRSDCMFIADGPRPICLQGQKKIVRSSKPDNTIDVNILPYIKFASGLNTNYGAGYLNWYQITDEFTGDYFWCPPSIKAMGVYLNTDNNFNYWDAPAGLNRGIVNALDVAFSPTTEQAGPMYNQNWNYAVNYPQDGIAIMGQKTFQTKTSALDRVNVRRLLLRLERQSAKISKYILFEGNTQYVRQRLVDLLDPMFREAKVGGGIYDYLIKCDESNNTPDTIDRNELHVQIGIKPTKTIEFLYIDFIVASTGASWSEVM